MTIKQNLHNQCLSAIDSRLKTLHNVISEIQESLLSETKSSAGDKHETGRAMLQLEREKTGYQLAETEKLKRTLQRIDANKKSKTVGLGSVVFTSQLNYYIALSLGELKVENNCFYAVSPTTPMGRLLIGKLTGDRIMFNDQEIKIEAIL